MGTEPVKRKVSRLRESVQLLGQGLNHLLWPAVCSNCGENICETQHVLCGDCWDELLSCAAGDYCGSCGRDASKYGILAGVCPECQGKKIYFDGITRGGVYGKALQRMILSFKNGRTELDSVLSFLADSALKGCSFRGEIEILVPVPLHWTRRLMRGFNQSGLLARRLRNSNVKIIQDLVRIRRTKKQPAMASAAARAANVAGAFAVRSDHRYAGRNVCLVDDIKTTGATLNECARTLKEAGAAKVFAVVLAVAGQNID